MINPIELIQDYKDQGYSCEEAVQMAKADLHDKKVYNAKSNREHTLERLNNSNERLSEETSRHILTKRNYSV